MASFFDFSKHALGHTSHESDTPMVPIEAESCSAPLCNTKVPSEEKEVYFWHLNKNMTPSLELVHFNVCENGICNYRDGTVLGEHTSLKLSETFMKADKIRLSIHLNHENAVGAAGTAKAPVCVRKYLNDTNQTLQQKWPLANNEMWIQPRESGRMIAFKKRGWALSTWYRKVCAERWPKFVLAATMVTENGQEITEISKEFEVRSKEQGHKTRAARGLSSTVTKRRTPETERRECELRQLQANIIERREAIQKVNTENTDLMTRFEFMRRILESSSSEHARQLLRLCTEHDNRMQKWKS